MSTEPTLSEAAVIEILKRGPLWKSRKPCLEMQLESNTGSGEATKSKFGGHPITVDGQEAPKCRCCKNELSLLLQLDLEDTKVRAHFAKATEPHWLQVFFCFNDECESQSEMGEVSRSTMIRSFKKPSKPLIRELAKPLSEHRVIGFKEWEDVPNPFDEDSDWVSSLPQEEQDALLSSVSDFFPRKCDKVGGFPAWIQGPEIPQCKECRREKQSDTGMQFVLQLESHPEWEILFGDLGAAFVFQCERHPALFSLIWQCS